MKKQKRIHILHKGKQNVNIKKSFCMNNIKEKKATLEEKKKKKKHYLTHFPKKTKLCICLYL